MARLGDHPHIVTIHDVGDEGVQPYIVSQYMAGGSLDELLRGAESHRLAVARVVRIAIEICQALEHAHAQHIIHRDLKPSNVWLTRDGTAKLGDFGLTVALDRSRLTVEGMMVGTVAYMPPEERPASATAVCEALAALSSPAPARVDQAVREGATPLDSLPVTLLFTDLVNSTTLLQRVGDEKAQRIFQAHHRMLKDAVAE